jgi:hypothetical protein
VKSTVNSLALVRVDDLFVHGLNIDSSNEHLRLGLSDLLALELFIRVVNMLDVTSFLR